MGRPSVKWSFFYVSFYSCSSFWRNWFFFTSQTNVFYQKKTCLKYLFVIFVNRQCNQKRYVFLNHYMRNKSRVPIWHRVKLRENAEVYLKFCFNRDKSGFYSATCHCCRRFSPKVFLVFIEDKVPFSSCFFCTELYPESSLIISNTFGKEKTLLPQWRVACCCSMTTTNEVASCLLLFEKGQEKIRREPSCSWIRRWGDTCEVGSHKCWVYSEVTCECISRIR